MNTRKLFFGLMAFTIMIAAAACTENTADDAVYEQGVDKRTVINGDSKSVDKRTVINGDKKSVDKRTIVNGDAN